MEVKGYKLQEGKQCRNMGFLDFTVLSVGSPKGPTCKDKKCWTKEGQRESHILWTRKWEIWEGSEAMLFHGRRAAPKFLTSTVENVLHNLSILEAGINVFKESTPQHLIRNKTLWVGTCGRRNNEMVKLWLCSAGRTPLALHIKYGEVILTQRRQIVVRDYSTTFPGLEYRQMVCKGWVVDHFICTKGIWVPVSNNEKISSCGFFTPKTRGWVSEIRGSIHRYSPMVFMTLGMAWDFQWPR